MFVSVDLPAGPLSAVCGRNELDSDDDAVWFLTLRCRDQEEITFYADDLDTLGALADGMRAAVALRRQEDRAEMCQADRALIGRLTEALAAGFTSAGHVSIRNERESTGYCSWRGCAPICRQRRQLLLDATDRLGYGEQPATRQPALMEAS